jgi:5-hydroxyisourate hydrolase
MSAISTHILDTVLGKPAAGIAVQLERMLGGWSWSNASASAEAPERTEDAKWIRIASAVTDADGRCPSLARDAKPGVYRLTFATGNYLERMGRTSMYPEIAITFTCDNDAHYHLPLLLSDNCYTTYRGS